MPGRDGTQTRAAILRAAMDQASRHGLGSVTYGQVARDAGVSRGAVANHFPSIEELHLGAAVEAANVINEWIVGRMLDAEPGLARLRRGLEAWADYLADPPFAHGCFFVTTTVESAQREGPAAAAAAGAARFGLDTIEEQIRIAVRQGELRADVDPAQLAFELHAFLQEGNWGRRLGDEHAMGRTRRAIRDRIHAVSIGVPAQPVQRMVSPGPGS